MGLELLESSRHWRATVEYQGSHGQVTAYLMDDGLIGGAYYWLIAGASSRWPSAERGCDPKATARLIAAGKLQLIRGQWPDVIRELLPQTPNLIQS